jgi:tRNA threonylcarbamoyladenosine biosynthesis protein TsaB
MILAIDTATHYAGLALYRPGAGLLAEETWYTDRNHTLELMPRLMRMLALAGLKVPALSALAVSLGPGSFTGLRIGLAAAKGLALPHKLPLLGVPTLELAAYPFREEKQPIWAIVGAGRGRILAGCYTYEAEACQEVVKPYITDFEALGKQIKKPALCVGEIDEPAAETLLRLSRKRARVASPAARLRRAGYLAEIAAARLAAGGPLPNPDTLEPLYP